MPESAIVVENEAKNTEENAKLVKKMVERWSGGEVEKRPKVLLVTSAWHMKRSLLMMKKYAKELEVIPAPCDCEATGRTFSGFELTWLKPEPGTFYFNSVYFHEWLGYWGYKLLRKILHVVPGLNEKGNGIAVVAKLVAQEQAKSGAEVEVVDTKEFISTSSTST